jgi:hypothetical protein
VAVDEAVDPETFEGHWSPRLVGIELSVVVVRPSLDVALERGAERPKRVRRGLVREQHAATSRWPSRRTIDTAGQSVEESLQAARRLIDDDR